MPSKLRFSESTLDKGLGISGARSMRLPASLSRSLAVLVVRNFVDMALRGQGPGGATRNRFRRPAPRIPILSATSGLNDKVGTELLHETSFFGNGTTLGKGKNAAYLHVDDGLLIAQSEQKRTVASDLMSACADTLEATGFVVADRRAPDELDKIIDYRP